jgi:hypothetical protein
LQSLDVNPFSLFLLLLPTSFGLAAGLQLDLPAQCDPGIDCWVINYADRDPGPGTFDHTCGSQTYNGHDGTDLAVRDMVAVRRGVNVVAAADGVVLRSRDGEPEGLDQESLDRAKAIQRECGNGLVIDHGGGWTTQYCHMKRGSLIVQPGDRVDAGQPLGQIGLSGSTQFPHVHLQVRHYDENIDPFTGTPVSDTCASRGKSMWSDDLQDKLSYRTSQIYNAGFAAGAPDLTRLREGEGYPQTVFACDVPALVAWMETHGTRAGHRYLIKVTDRKGAVLFEREETLEKSQARIFRYTGRRLRTNCWTPGTYSAVFQTLDSDTVLSEKKLVLTISSTRSSD